MSSREILRRVALWNAVILGGGGAAVAGAYALAGNQGWALAVLAGAWAVAFSTLISALVDASVKGALAGGSYVIKLLVIFGVVLALDSYTDFDKRVFLAAMIVAVVAALAIDGWVILRQPGPGLDIEES